MDADGNDRTERPFYQAYLIRLWRESRKGTWRASAQSVTDGHVTRFGTLQALYAFLERETWEATSEQLESKEQDRGEQ